MEEWIDLHVHSTASDGSMNPKELVRYAKSKGLIAIALTDHDTIEGIEPALAEGKEVGLEVIPGIEISSDYTTEMHILGYFFHDTYRNITKVLETLQENRNNRNPKIIHKLNELGFDITLEEASGEALGSIVGRPHIAKVLVRKGYVKNTEQAFNKYLSYGKPAYFKKDKLTPEESIQEILSAGGIPVLAHPIFLNLKLKHLDVLLERLKSAGLRGIEGYYAENTANDTGNLLRLALKHDLLVTGGSDFHGSFKKGIEIGCGRGNLKVPVELLSKLKEAAERRARS